MEVAGLVASKPRQREQDGCPTFAKAYVGRKRRAQANERFFWIWIFP